MLTYMNVCIYVFAIQFHTTMHAYIHTSTHMHTNTYTTGPWEELSRMYGCINKHIHTYIHT